MPKENNRAHLIDQLEHAYEILGGILALIKDERGEVAATTKKAHKVKKPSASSLDFSMPVRPFIKKYSAGMNGQRKFTLLLARLAKGDENKHVPLLEIEQEWNKMTAKNLLGMKFNRFYSSQAKENDWVNSEKAGTYHLRPSWKDILSE